ncbi:hypothetical protein AS9A_2051 [Hoyosella subflava DQS3-9A1]|uniref:Uncharacterized protein n=1 Tax=Hoyosella subflava (strain DSM 45089 / JCM 17490 / NBRC 109087 / DQS3-9A1) TaxID=443218 RepID=F6EP34_HOYSD|nr:hypothetical protein AS9A_2051 [Hoyosella subflava DQS3-9A1]
MNKSGNCAHADIPGRHIWPWVLAFASVLMVGIGIGTTLCPAENCTPTVVSPSLLDPGG